MSVRGENADSSRIALAVLNRYKFLFCLPNTIERNSKMNEFDIIVNDYARAKNLFGKTEVIVSRKYMQICFKLLIFSFSLDFQKSSSRS